MKFPRFSVRTLMTFVAVVALASSVIVILWGRSTTFAAIAEKHHRQMLADRLNITGHGSHGASLLPFNATPEELEEAHREALSKLTPEEKARGRFLLRRAAIEKRQYELFYRASLYPWLPAPEETKLLLMIE